MANEHTKIINKIAKEKFTPFGIVQKGRSRTWIDDNGWFTTIIEFQPSSYSRGSYLNVAVNFNWYEKDWESFDLSYHSDGSREGVYLNKYNPLNLFGRSIYWVDYEPENEEYFIKIIELYCDVAIKRVKYFRKKLATLRKARRVILRTEFCSDELWGSYHKGTICGLTGWRFLQKRYYKRLLNEVRDAKLDFEIEARESVSRLITYDLNTFKEEIKKIITETRKLKKLPEIQINL